jgi:hypothetical protein
MWSLTTTSSSRSVGRLRTFKPGRLSSQRRRTLTSMRLGGSLPMFQKAAALR